MSYRGVNSYLALATAAAATTVSLLGCERSCTQEARDGLNITVRDARTGTPLCDSTVVAIDGSFHETLTNFSQYDAAFPPCTFHGAEERAGTYRVLINRDGYVGAELSALTVGAGDCHIANEIERTVELQPEPSVSDAGRD
jgi:hypothetical protein